MPEQGDRWHRPSAAELKKRRAECAQREAAEEAARKEALQIVERWNRALAAGRGGLWSPTIRAAVLAGMPWLDVYCPGCRTSRALDIRKLDRHPLASVGMGLIDIGWAMTDDTFTMSWTEHNGPPVRPPEHKGFGSTVIDSMARRTLGGEVQLDYAPRDWDGA